MKFLRALYMIIASIVLLPVIVLVEMVLFIFIVAMCTRMERTRDSIRFWFNYLREGINMNLDFIENGF
jgi:hypothetical protein